MPATSPLRNLHAQAEARFIHLPPAGSVCAGGAQPVELVGAFGDPDAEHAAIAHAAGLLDRPDRALVTLTGADRLDFLNRLLTQRLRDLPPGRWSNAFLLNRQGRILADARAIALDDRTLLETHAADAPALADQLAGAVFTEDVAVHRPDPEDAPAALMLIGPHAPAVLAASTGADADATDPPEHGVSLGSLADADLIVTRDDAIGVPTLTLFVPRHRAVAVYHRLLETDGVRAIGWSALDEARVRARVPLHLLDFGPASLPHETGALRDRVSFTKGCYPGQEIVARMQSRGGPKQVLVALAFDRPEPPAIGALLRPTDQPDADAVGLVTSPAPGSADLPAVALALVRTRAARVGARLDADRPATITALVGD